MGKLNFSWQTGLGRKTISSCKYYADWSAGFLFPINLYTLINCLLALLFQNKNKKNTGFFLSGKLLNLHGRIKTPKAGCPKKFLKQ